MSNEITIAPPADNTETERSPITFADLSPIEMAAQYGALMNMEQVAEYLGVPAETIAKWRERHKGPKARLVGRHLRYRLSDVNEWLDTLPLG